MLETIEEFRVGDLVEGKVIAINRSTVYIDLPPFGTGIIYGREFLVAKDILRKSKVGDSISAKIIDLETPEGYIDLSLKEARKAQIWSEAEESMGNGRVYEVIVKNANRGGLVIEWNGIRGFLPASQLSEKNYPKVINGDKDTILNELKKLIGQKISVVISTIDPKTDNLIFSEFSGETRLAEDGETLISEAAPIVKIEVGDVKTGIVTGVVDFGVFVRLNENIEGLVHISEIDWGLVDDPRKFYSAGDQITIKVIELQNDKYSFSVKALKRNPWEEAKTRYKTGDEVSGVILKYSQHGAFASIEAGVTGLVHISSFKDEEELRANLGIGKTYKFKISNFSSEEQKLTLTSLEDLVS